MHLKTVEKMRQMNSSVSLKLIASNIQWGVHIHFHNARYCMHTPWHLWSNELTKNTLNLLTRNQVGEKILNI
jgi:hypothetical protein